MHENENWFNIFGEAAENVSIHCDPNLLESIWIFSNKKKKIFFLDYWARKLLLTARADTNLGKTNAT